MGLFIYLCFLDQSIVGFRCPIILSVLVKYQDDKGSIILLLIKCSNIKCLNFNLIFIFIFCILKLLHKFIEFNMKFDMRVKNNEKVFEAFNG